MDQSVERSSVDRLPLEESAGYRLQLVAVVAQDLSASHRRLPACRGSAPSESPLDRQCPGRPSHSSVAPAWRASRCSTLTEVAQTTTAWAERASRSAELSIEYPMCLIATPAPKERRAFAEGAAMPHALPPSHGHSRLAASNERPRNHFEAASENDRCCWSQWRGNWATTGSVPARPGGRTPDLRRSRWKKMGNMNGESSPPNMANSSVRTVHGMSSRRSRQYRAAARMH